MSNNFQELLSSPDISVRINAIKQFDDPSIPAKERANLFRLASEDVYYEIREAVAQMIHTQPINDVIESLLHDQVPQVRIATIKNSEKIRRAMNNDYILELMKDNVKDPVASVRCALADIIHQHTFLTAQTQNEKAQTDENLLETFTRTKLNDIFLQNGLLLDPNDDVRIAASNNYRYFISNLGFDFVFCRLYNSLHVMFIDSQWRIRTNAAELVFALSMLSETDYFDEYLYPFIEKFLLDSCQKVRDYTISSLPTLVEHFCMHENGEKDMTWLMKSLLVNLEKTYSKSDNFIYQQAYIYCLSELASYIPTQYLRNVLFLPMIRKLKATANNDNVIILILDTLLEFKDNIHPFQKTHELKPILDNLMINSTKTIQDRAKALLV
ncbi:HEAT repeat family protein [Tritrichomonas foetus]|uniref:HEAT repeat family protein n=1 Tax=Tritrichomonas foetus TaxID=1144522 RepID=A0A1J4KRK7_9EUKA|nr:HEAT repeat family protein [Tritrichomonas foetus]|eukprot:OHT12302.1 HEAT repeat family protein [Tritrichomonas foetus]